MQVNQYNPVTMTLLSSDITGVDFGNVVKGNHSTSAITIKPVAEMGETITQLALFLEDNASMDNTQFGKFKNAAPTPGIGAGSDYLSDYFTEVEGISDVSQIGTYSDYGLVFTASNPEYAWIDAEVGLSETTLGAQAVNFRFVFEYS